jgi:hypothetical protein
MYLVRFFCSMEWAKFLRTIYGSIAGSYISADREPAGCSGSRVVNGFVQEKIAYRIHKKCRELVLFIAHQIG